MHHEDIRQRMLAPAKEDEPSLARRRAHEQQLEGRYGEFSEYRASLMRQGASWSGEVDFIGAFAEAWRGLDLKKVMKQVRRALDNRQVEGVAQLGDCLPHRDGKRGVMGAYKPRTVTLDTLGDFARVQLPPANALERVVEKVLDDDGVEFGDPRSRRGSHGKPDSGRVCPSRRNLRTMSLTARQNCAADPLGPYLPHASTSAIRDQVASALARTEMRMRSVAYAGNQTVRFTRLFPRTLASVTHAVPFQA